MSSALPENAASTRASLDGTLQVTPVPSASPQEITGAQMISAAFENSQERNDLPFYTGKARSPFCNTTIPQRSNICN